jgi:hypothetical protein
MRPSLIVRIFDRSGNAWAVVATAALMAIGCQTSSGQRQAYNSPPAAGATGPTGGTTVADGTPASSGRPDSNGVAPASWLDGAIFGPATITSGTNVSAISLPALNTQQCFYTDLADGVPTFIFAFSSGSLDTSSTLLQFYLQTATLPPAQSTWAFTPSQPSQSVSYEDQSANIYETTSQSGPSACNFTVTRSAFSGTSSTAPQGDGSQILIEPFNIEGTLVCTRLYGDDSSAVAGKYLSFTVSIGCPGTYSTLSGYTPPSATYNDDADHLQWTFKGIATWSDAKATCTSDGGTLPTDAQVQQASAGLATSQIATAMAAAPIGSATTYFWTNISGAGDAVSGGGSLTYSSTDIKLSVVCVKSQ